MYIPVVYLWYIVYRTLPSCLGSPQSFYSPLRLTCSTIVDSLCPSVLAHGVCAWIFSFASLKVHDGRMSCMMGMSAHHFRAWIFSFASLGVHDGYVNCVMEMWAHCLYAWTFSFAILKVHGVHLVNCMMDLRAVRLESGNAWPMQNEQLCTCVSLSKQCCAKGVGFELNMPDWATHADETMKSL